MYMKYSRMFTSFINHRIRRFHVVVVQWTSNWNLLKKKKSDARADLAPVIQTSDNAIHWINHYPADNVIDFRNT